MTYYRFNMGKTGKILFGLFVFLILLFSRNTLYTSTIVGFSRSQLIIIRESLFALKREKFEEICHTRGNMKDLEENDPVYRKAGQVLEMVEKLLNDTREDVLKEIAENSKETVPEMLAIIHGGGREKESGAE